MIVPGSWRPTASARSSAQRSRLASPGRSRGSSNDRLERRRDSRASGRDGRCPCRAPRRDPRNLEGVVDSLFCRNGTASKLSAERLPLEKLHHRVHDPCLHPEVEDGEDARMGKRRNRFRLALEASQRVGSVATRLQEAFDRDVPVQLVIARAVETSHSTSADRREDLVTEPSIQWEGRCGVRLHEPRRRPAGPRDSWLHLGARSNSTARITRSV